jgi:hypothetical protein
MTEREALILAAPREEVPIPFWVGRKVAENRWDSSGWRSHENPGTGQSWNFFVRRIALRLDRIDRGADLARGR